MPTCCTFSGTCSFSSFSAALWKKTVGPQKLLAIFFIGGFTSFILGPAFLPRGTGMLGASAAIFALAGCVMLVKPLKFSWLFLAPQGLIAIVYFIYNVVVVYEKSRIPGYDPQVAYVAHVIGFLTGIPFGIAPSDYWKRNLFITLLLLGIYIALVSGVARAVIQFGALHKLRGNYVILGKQQRHVNGKDDRHV